MFAPHHEIWQFAKAADRFDEWLDYAVCLVDQWTSQNKDEVKFRTTFEIYLASLLLMDDLLPPSARKAFANLTLEILAEVSDKKLAIECLHITSPRPGRMEDRHFLGKVFFGVHQLIQTGSSKTEAYEAIAAKYFKSPDTIRRIYERTLKKMHTTPGGIDD